MTGLIRRATLLTAVGLLVASAAMAGVPSTGTSAQPAGVTLVGHNAGIADGTSFGAMTYTIRDAANNPVPNSVVVMNFAACTGTRICSTTQPAGMFVNCAARSVSGVTNASGVVTFRIVGGGIQATPDVAACVSVTADGVALNTLRASMFDISGAGGLALGDITVAKNDLNLFPARTRADVSKNGILQLGDITIMKNTLNAGGSSTSCTSATCP